MQASGNHPWLGNQKPRGQHTRYKPEKLLKAPLLPKEGWPKAGVVPVINGPEITKLKKKKKFSVKIS